MPGSRPASLVSPLRIGPADIVTAAALRTPISRSDDETAAAVVRIPSVGLKLPHHPIDNLHQLQLCQEVDGRFMGVSPNKYMIHFRHTL